MLIKRTVTPECYKRGEATLNRWLEEIHNNGKADHRDKEEVEKRYSKLIVNKFRTDGK